MFQAHSPLPATGETGHFLMVLDGAGETAPTLSAALRKRAAAAHPTRGVATAIPHAALREAAANTNPPQRPPSGLSLTPYPQLSASNFHLESDLR